MAFIPARSENLLIVTQTKMLDNGDLQLKTSIIRSPEDIGPAIMSGERLVLHDVVFWHLASAG